MRQPSSRSSSSLVPYPSLVHCSTFSLSLNAQLFRAYESRTSSQVLQQPSFWALGGGEPL